MKNIPYALPKIDGRDIEAVNHVLRTSFLTQGPKVAKFERSVADYCGAKFAVAVNSGTSALHIACMAASLSQGDEVITTPNTFVATSNAILYCNAHPVFADINIEDGNINVEDIKRTISRKTRVILPVDYAGQPADMEQIYSIAKKHNLLVIEDASHSIGASIARRKVGSGAFADMTTFSFHAVKNITTGEGGMVLTNNKQLYKRLLLFRTHGITRDPSLMYQNHGQWYYEMRCLGYNYRLTDIQSSLGMSQLKKLNLFIMKRKRIASLYDNSFKSYDSVAPLKHHENRSSANHIYVLRFLKVKSLKDKRRIVNEYQKKGILVNVHYIPVYLQRYYQKLGYQKGECAQAEQFYMQAVTLPLHPHLSMEQINRILKTTYLIIAKICR